MSEALARSAYLTNLRENAFLRRQGLWLTPEEKLDFVPARNKWRAQRSLLARIAQRLPLIILGNTRLEHDMRDELGVLGVSELTIQVQDWWPLFTLIASKARIIFFFIEDVSSALTEEMKHVLQFQFRYVVLCEESRLMAIRSQGDWGEDFLRGAVCVFTFRPASLGDPAPIDLTKIDTLLERQGISPKDENTTPPVDPASWAPIPSI